MDEEKTVAEEATDDNLSALWDSVKGQEALAKDDVTEVKEEVKEPAKEVVKEETKQPEAKEELPPEKASEATPAPKEEKEDHKESSKLGRKVHGLYEVIDQLKAEVDRLKKPVSQEPDIVVPDVISTPEDVQIVLAAERQKNQREQEARATAAREYETGFTRQLVALGEANEDLHGEIMDLIMENAKKGSTEFNAKFSDNPSADARVNYAEAKAFILSKKLSEGSGKPKLPVRETAAAPPVQPAAGATKMDVKPASAKKLSPEAEHYMAYLRRQGTSEEEIEEYTKE